MSKIDIDLASATITEMSALLRQRTISPVALVAATLLYRVAYAYEQATEWHLRYPALKKLLVL